MRIETDLKLGFKDVLIRPKRSTLKAGPRSTWNGNLLFCTASGSGTGPR